MIIFNRVDTNYQLLSLVKLLELYHVIDLVLAIFIYGYYAIALFGVSFPVLCRS